MTRLRQALRANWQRAVSAGGCGSVQVTHRHLPITYYQMPVPKDPANLEKWSGLRTVGVAIRQSASVATSSSEVRFFIASIPMGIKHFASYVRGHWAYVRGHWAIESMRMTGTTGRFGHSLLTTPPDAS